METIKFGVSFANWYKYIIPKRMVTHYYIFRWLCFIWVVDRERYQKNQVQKGIRSSFIYCPKCNADLIENNSFIEDTDFVYYKCTNCGTKSKWDFDAPCPILMDSDIKLDGRGK